MWLWLCLGVGLVGFWIGAMTCYYLMMKDSREDLDEGK